jgi:DNA-binding response OmpR family regulator
MRVDRILVIEDDERSAELIRATLGQLSVELTFVASLAQARRRLAEGLPGMLLLDLRLPDGSGADLVREVRALPGGDRVRIVAVSASVRPSDREVALGIGCDDFVEKPISPRDLVARLRRWQDAPR